MPLVLRDRVKETTTTTGTGTLTLAGAATGFQSFSVIGNGNTTYYCIASQGSSEWEVGIGTYTSVGTTLARTTVLASSNAGSLVALSAGTKDVFVVYPSGRAVAVDGTTFATYGMGATQGDIIYASATDTFSRLAKDATATRYLSNTGASNNPAWAQVNLANGVTGTLPTANGGTNLTSFTTNGAVYATSTSALTTGTLPLASGGTGQVTAQAAINSLAGAVTSGQYLRGNGTNVVMSAIQAGDVPTLNQNTTGSAGSVANAATFNNGGTGAASGTTFNGSSAVTVSYNTIGAPSTTGTNASGTWGISISGTAGNASSISSAVGSGYTWTGVQYFTSTTNTASSAGDAKLQAYATSSGAAVMSFHRPGLYATNMGLDSDNVFRIGGWSASANRLQMDMSGNLTMAGNVTAYSDERLKKDWASLPSDFVYRLAKVKNGTYTRVDDDLRQVGVSAQSLDGLLPEAVLKNNEYLSVAYGNAALAACVELAKEVMALRAEIEAIKASSAKVVKP